jgi:predicted CopG family antitoxin
MSKMPSKNISIKKETYDKLMALKKKKESFTDIIEFLLQNTQSTGKSLEPFFGIWKDDSFLTIEEIHHERDSVNKQLQKRFQ